MPRRSPRYFWLLLALCPLHWACGPDGAGQPPEEAPVQVPVLRLEERLARLRDTLQGPAAPNCASAFARIWGPEQFVLAFALYQADSAQLAAQPQAQEALALDFCQLARDSMVGHLLDSSLAHWPAGPSLARVVQPVLARFATAFPTQPLPRVATLAMGPDRRNSWDFDFQALEPRWYPKQRLLMLALDHFCGPGFPFLHPETPRYVRRICTPERLPVALALALAVPLQPELQPFDQPAFVHYCLNAGLRLFLAQQLVPHAPDSLLLGYSGAHMAWALEHEKELYAELKPLLFEKNDQRFRRYLTPGASTPSIGNGKEAPARLGEFLGWRMVQAWVRNHPDARLEDVLATRTYDEFFKNSGYAP